MADRAPDMIDARLRMVRKHLQSRGINNRRLLDVMGEIPRERFIPPDMTTLAYEDRALPIGQGQTISQPYIVALMTQALELTGGEHVLEIGTGSGYQTAILAALAGDVVSIERHAVLSEQARSALDDLDIQNVKLIVGDGTQSWPTAAPTIGLLSRLPPARARPCSSSSLPKRARWSFRWERPTSRCSRAFANRTVKSAEKL